MSVAGEVHDEPRMLVDAPARVEGKVAGHESRRVERPIAPVERDPDAVHAEADDVGPAVTGQVRKEARKCRTPALVEAKLLESEPEVTEGAVSIAESGPRPRVAEAKDVDAPITIEIDDEARMIAHAPAGIRF